MRDSYAVRGLLMMPGGIAHIGHIVTGAYRPDEALREFVRTSRGGELFIDAMTWDGSLALSALQEALSHGTRVTMLASPLVTPEKLRSISAAPGQLRVISYDSLARASTGVSGLWQHSKIAAHAAPDGGVRAAFSNVSPSSFNHHDNDVFVELHGPTAAAAVAVGRSWDALPDVRGAALDAAAAHGLLYNDPSAAGRAFVSDAYWGAVHGSSSHLQLLIKGLDDVALARDIAAAHQRGVSVAGVVHSITMPVDDVLKTAAVPTLISRGGAPKNRLNMVVSDAGNFVTTAYPLESVLRRAMYTGVTAGRESALRLSDGDAARMLSDAAAQTVEGAMLVQMSNGATPGQIAERAGSFTALGERQKLGANIVSEVR